MSIYRSYFLLFSSYNFFFFFLRHAAFKIFWIRPKRVFTRDEDNTTPLYSSPCLYRFSYTYTIPRGTLIEKCNFIGDWSKNKMFTRRFVCKTRVSRPFAHYHHLCAKAIRRTRNFRFSCWMRTYTRVHLTVGLITQRNHLKFIST